MARPNPKRQTYKKISFIGVEQFPKWIEECNKYKGGTVSPGGMATLLKVGRIRATQIIEREQVQLIEYKKSASGKGYYRAITVQSIKKFAQSLGKELTSDYFNSII